MIPMSVSPSVVTNQKYRMATKANYIEIGTHNSSYFTRK